MDREGAPASAAPTPVDPADRPPRLATWLISRLSAKAARIAAGRFGAVGLAKHHYTVLAWVDAIGPTSQAQLSARTGIDRSDIVAILGDLEDRGAVLRATDPADRRRNCVSITPSGAELLVTLYGIVAAAQEEFLAPLDARQRDEFTRLATLLLGDEEAYGAPYPPVPPSVRRGAGGDGPAAAAGERSDGR